MSYEDETRQRIEARKRNAELKKEQQIKKKKNNIRNFSSSNCCYCSINYCCSFSFSQER